MMRVSLVRPEASDGFAANGFKGCNSAGGSFAGSSSVEKGASNAVARSSSKRLASLALMLFSLMAACILMAGTSTAAYAATAGTANYVWYAGGTKTTYTLSNASDFRGFVNLVNGEASGYARDSFKGKTVTLGANINFVNSAVKPIGTKTKPFEGTFDGMKHSLANVSVDTTGRTNSVGLFGYCGSSSELKNVRLQNVKLILSNTTQSAVLEDIGLLIGHSEGFMRACSTAASSLSVKSSSNSQKGVDRLRIRNVGGLAGFVKGDVENCSNAASVTVTETGKPLSENEPDIMTNTGGVVGCVGDMASQNTTQSVQSQGKGTLSGCTNSGTITVDTPMRLGQGLYSESFAVSVCTGGVVGYSKSNITDCHNTGYVKAEHGSTVGGVAGSLRGMIDKLSGADGGQVRVDDGFADSAARLSMTNCTNNGNVYARMNIGGIVAITGCKTAVLGCINGSPSSVGKHYVIGNRTAKPMIGGVVGNTAGVVAFCGNYGICASAVWDKEGQTIKKQSGFYVAGVVSTTRQYTDPDSKKSADAPEVYSCVNMGPLIVTDDMRSRNIVAYAEDGRQYDCFALEGLCYNSAGNPAMGFERTYGINEMVSSEVMRTNGQFSKDDGRTVFEVLNSHASEYDYQYYWVKTAGGEALPTVSGVDPQQGGAASEKIDLSKAAFTQTKAAPFIDAEGSKPTLRGKLSDGTELVQDVDFYVVPQAGAKEMTGSAKPYTATIKPLGRYTGEAQASYGIGKLDLSTCSVTIEPDEFNWKGQAPSTEDIVVKTAVGTVVKPGSYTWEFDYKNTEFDWSHTDLSEEGYPINGGKYSVRVYAPATSTLSEGSVTGTYRINRIDLKYDSSLQETNPEKYAKSARGLSLNAGTSLEEPWQSVRELRVNGGTEDITAVFPYTGHPIIPTVQIEHLGHIVPTYFAATTSGKKLGEQDYATVKMNRFGIPDASKGNYLYYGSTVRIFKGFLTLDTSGGDGTVKFGVLDAENVGRPDRVVAGGITINSYISDSVSYGNYQSNDGMMFYIDPSLTPLLDDATVTVTMSSDGKPSVKVVYLGSALTPDTDYKVTYKEDDASGDTLAVITPGSNGLFGGSQEVPVDADGTDQSSYKVRFQSCGGSAVAGQSVQKGGAATRPADPQRDGYEFVGWYTSRSCVVGSEYDFATPVASSLTLYAKWKPLDVLLTVKTYYSDGTIKRAYKFKACNLDPLAALNTTPLTFAGTDAGSKESWTATKYVTAEQLVAACASGTLKVADTEKVQAKSKDAKVESAWITFAQAKTAPFVIVLEGTHVSKDGTSAQLQKPAALIGAQGGTAVSGLSDADRFAANICYLNINLTEKNPNPSTDSVAKAKVTLSASKAYYTGKALKPAVKSVVLDGVTLKANKDYTVSYANNTKIGTATVTIKGAGSYNGTVKKTFSIVAKKGATFSASGIKYKVTSASGQVAVIKGSTKKSGTVTIPATVKYGGKSFKVTSIAASAFKGYSKITKVTVGKNVASIGKQAFYKCSKLKTITLKTTKLTSSKVGSKAFTGVYKKATFKVPASKLKAYTKILKARGATSSMKIKK